MFEVILGSFGALVSEWPLTKKAVGLRAKQGVIWKSGVVVIIMCMGYL